MSYSALTPSPAARSVRGFINMYPPPRAELPCFSSAGICGTCPRGAGGMVAVNGAAFSPPEYINPSSPGVSQPGSPQNSSLNTTPLSTSQW